MNLGLLFISILLFVGLSPGLFFTFFSNQTKFMNGVLHGILFFIVLHVYDEIIQLIKKEE